MSRYRGGGEASLLNQTNEVVQENSDRRRRLAAGVTAAALLIPPAAGGIGFWELHAGGSSQFSFGNHVFSIQKDRTISAMLGVFAGIVADGVIITGVTGTRNSRRMRIAFAEREQDFHD